MASFVWDLMWRDARPTGSSKEYNSFEEAKAAALARYPDAEIKALPMDGLYYIYSKSAGRGNLECGEINRF